MYKLSLFLCLFLAACATVVSGGNLASRWQEPYLEEVPKLPLGRITTKKQVKVNNPLQLPVQLVLECRNQIVELKVDAHRYVLLEVPVDTEQVESRACRLLSWDTVRGF